MSEVLGQKKLALNLVLGIRPQEQALLSQMGFELISDPSYIGDDITAIIIDQQNSNYEELDKLYQIVEKNISLIHLGEISHYGEFIKYNGKIVLSADSCSEGMSLTALKRFGQDKFPLHIDDFGVLNPKQIKIAHLGNPLRSGFYADLVASEAFESNHDPVRVKGALTSILGYLTYLKDKEIVRWPIELEYLAARDEFISTLVIGVEDFSMEYFWEGFGEINHQNPSQYLLTNVARLSHYFDVYYLASAKKLFITMIWNSQYLGDKSLPGTLVLGNLTTQYQRIRIAQEAAKSPALAIEKATAIIAQELRDKKLPESLALILTTAGPDSNLAKSPHKFLDLSKQLKDFLAQNNIDPATFKSPEELLNLLQTLNPDFEIPELQMSEWQSLINFVKSPENIEKLEKELAESDKNVSAQSVDEMQGQDIAKKLMSKIKKRDNGGGNQKEKGALNVKKSGRDFFNSDDLGPIVVSGVTEYIEEESNVVKEALAKTLDNAIKNKEMGREQVVQKLLSELGIEQNSLSEAEKEELKNELSEELDRIGQQIESGENPDNLKSDIQGVADKLAKKLQRNNAVSPALRKSAKLREKIQSKLPPEINEKIRLKSDELIKESKEKIAGERQGQDEKQTISAREENKSNDIQKVKGGKVKDDSDIQRVKGNLDKSESDVTKVKGQTEEVDDGITKVAGSKDEVSSDDIQRIVGDAINLAKQEKWTSKKLSDELKKNLSTVIPGSAEQLEELVESVVQEASIEAKDKAISKSINAGLGEKNEELIKVQFLKAIQEKDQKIKELNQKLDKAKIELATAKDMSQIRGKVLGPNNENEQNVVKLSGEKKSEDNAATVVKGDNGNAQDQALEVKKLQELTAEKTIDDIAKAKNILSTGNEILEKLEAGKALTEFEIENLKRLAQEGIVSNETAQSAVMELKKLKTASDGQVSMLTKELESAKHAVRSREVMLVKVKEGFTHALDKKDKVLKQIKDRTDHLITKAQIQGQELGDSSLKLKKMKEERDDFSKQNEILKKKLAQKTNVGQVAGQAKSVSADDVEMKKITAELDRAKQDKIQTIQKLSIIGQEKIALEKKVKALEFQIKTRSGETVPVTTSTTATNQQEQTINPPATSSATPISKMNLSDSMMEEKLSGIMAENEKLKANIKAIQQKMLEERNQANAKDAKRIKDELADSAVPLSRTNPSLEAEELKQKVALLETEIQNMRQKDALKVGENSAQLAKERAGQAKDQEKALIALQEKQEAINKLKEVESRVMEKDSEIKTLDYKLKLAQKQIETLEKNSKKQNTKGKAGEESDSGLDAKTKHLIKQLEMKKEKADFDLAKTHTEMAEVKKEMAAQKSENMSLKNKIQQLEREVAKHKKAS